MAVFLILSIAFNTLFASSYKIAANKGCNLHIVNVWLYVGSTLTMLAFVTAKWQLALHPAVLIMGIAAGAMVFFATLSFFHHIGHGQLSASWTIISLAIAFPVLASILIWHEQPTVKQTIGLALIVIALVLFGRHETSNGRQT